MEKQVPWWPKLPLEAFFGEERDFQLFPRWVISKQRTNGKLTEIREFDSFVPKGQTRA